MESAALISVDWRRVLHALRGRLRAARRNLDPAGPPPTGHGLAATRSISRRLVLLAVACVIPVWLVVGFLFVQSYEEKVGAVERHMLGTARALAMTVDQQLMAVRGVLKALATSPLLANHDFASFHAQARTLLADYPGADIVLADSDGQQIINTYRPYGEPLPRRSVPEAVRRLFVTGEPVLSDLFLGAITKRPLIGIDVPVIQGGKVVYDLSITFPATRLGETLLHQRLPQDWVGAILDRSNVVAARSLNPEQFVGQHARPALCQSLAEMDEGLVETPTFEGLAGSWAFSRAAASGWTVVIGVPTASLMAEVRRWLVWTVVGTVTLSLGGIWLALQMGRRIAHSIRALTGPAAALGRGEPVTVGPQDLHETDEVGQALSRASSLLVERAQERDQAEQALAQRTRLLERHSRNLRTLNGIGALPQGPGRDPLSEALALAVRHLEMETAALVRIEGPACVIKHRVTPGGMGTGRGPGGSGTEFALDGTLGAATLEAADVLAIADLGRSCHSDWVLAPDTRCGCYIGAPVRVFGQDYGVVHFASSVPSLREFDDGDREFMVLLGRWMGAVLEHAVSDRELQTARQDAEVANRAKTEFLAMMSHEIRTPLTAILGFSEIIRDQIFGPVGTPAYADYAADINESGHHLLAVIGDILDITKIEAGRMETAPETVSLPGLLTITVRLVHERAMRRQLAVDIRVDQPVPVLWADPRAAKQILFNLLSNAIKYTPPGGRIVVSAASAGQGGVAISVADTGIGISPADLARVVRPFERFDNRYVRARGGTGLGLPLVKALAELHGGTLTIVSTPGVGTTVTVWFPPGPAA